MHNDSLQTIYCGDEQCLIPVYIMCGRCNFEYCTNNDLIKQCGELFYISSMYFDILKSIDKYDVFVLKLLKIYNETYKKSTPYVYFFDDLITNNLNIIVNFMSFCVKKQYEFLNLIYFNYKENVVETNLIENLIYEDKLEYYKTKMNGSRKTVDSLIVQNRFYFIENEKLIANLKCKNNILFDYFNKLESVIIEILNHNKFLKNINVFKK